MPTIKDIAREAGVSHGTVSNVINGRGNVSVEKIQLVWQAAEKLGYKDQQQGTKPPAGAGPQHCGASARAIEDRRWAAMYEVFQNEFIRHGYSVQLYSTRSMETTEKELLAAALAERVSAVISRSCLLDAAAYYPGRGPGASNCTPFSGKPCTRKCYVCRVRSRANGNRHRLASAAERTAADRYFYRACRISGYRAVSKWIPDGLCG